jgi:hypothetical protein
VTVLLCLPWLIAARSHFTTVLASYWVPPLDLLTVLSGTAGIAALGAYPGAWPWALGAAAAAPWAALLVASAVRARHSPEARAGLFLVLFPLALDLLVSLRRPLFLPRTLIYLLPPLLWLAAEAVRGRGRAAGAAWAAALLASLVPGAVLVHARDWREDWRGAVETVAAGVRPGEVVLVDSFLRRGYDYYAARHLALKGVPVVEIPRWEAVPDLAAFLAAARGAPPRTFWLLTRICEADEAVTRAAAAARFRVLSARERNSVAADHLEHP